MRRSPLVSILVIALVLILPISGESKQEEGGPAEETIAVDCTDPDPTKHGSIQDAIDGSKAQSVTVQITGMCQQSVFVRRDNVTLAGTNTASDGITGPAFVDPNQRALVTVRDVANITIDTLAITASESRGIEVSVGPTTAFLMNSYIHGNTSRGIQVNDGAYTLVTNSVIENNGNWQLITFGARLDCSNCTVGSGSEGLGVATSGGFILLGGSAVDVGNFGVYVDDAGRAFLDSTSDASGNYSLIAVSNSQVRWNGGGVATAAGTFYADGASQILLNGVTQTANTAFGNFLLEDSFLEVENSNLTGDTYIFGFSRATSEGSNDLGNNLTCHGGGDLWCDGFETKVSSGCGSCP